MSNTLTIPFDAAGLDPKVVNAFDDLIASVQTWAGRITANQSITGSFTAIQPRCRLALRNNESQAIADSTIAQIVWPSRGDAVDSPDFSTLYDNGVSFGGRFLETAGAFLIPPVAGQYLIIGRVRFQTNAVGFRYLELTQRYNGVATSTPIYLQLPNLGAATEPVYEISGVMTFRGRDYGDAVALSVFQNSGGSLNVLAGATALTLIKLS